MIISSRLVSEKVYLSSSVLSHGYTSPEMELCDEQKRDQHSYAGDSSKMFGNVHEIVCKR